MAWIYSKEVINKHLNVPIQTHHRALELILTIQ